MASPGMGIHRPRSSPMPQVLLSPAPPACSRPPFPLAALALTPVPNTFQSICMSPAGARPATSAAKQPATPEQTAQSSTSKPSPPAKTGKRARALSAAAPLCNCAPCGCQRADGVLTNLHLLRRCRHTKADQHANRQQGRGRASPTDGPAACGPELVSSEQVSRALQHSPTGPPHMNTTARAPFLHVGLAVCRFPDWPTATCSMWGQHCTRRLGRRWYGVRFPAHDYHEPTPGLCSGLL